MAHCDRCGKRLGFFSSDKHVMPSEDGGKYVTVCGDCLRLSSAPQEEVAGHTDYNHRLAPPAEAIRKLEAIGDLFPADERVSNHLFHVLISLPTATKPEASWPNELTDVIIRGDEVVQALAHGLEGNPDDHPGRKLHFAIALCYIRSPNVVEPLCSFLEKNIMMQLWPTRIELLGDDEITFFDAYEVIYIAIARAFYWNQANSILPRLRVILEKGKQKQMLNALPYAIRAIGFIGDRDDIPLIKEFIGFCCPEFDLSEAAVKQDAKHALYALTHLEEREIRANTHIDQWKSD